MKKNTSALALTELSPVAEPHGLQKLLLNLFLEIPESSGRKITDPRAASQAIARTAAMKAASVSGTLALPPGPLGWATILPDLVEVWRIQAQMVADIAAAHGKTAHLTKETLMFCLFKHGGAMVARDLVVRAGNQFVVRRMTRLAFQLALRKVGGRLTRTLVEKTIARSVPFIGALAVGGYAYYDTSKVAATAIALFSGEIVIAEESPRKRGATKNALVAAVKTATSLKKNVAVKSNQLATEVKKKVTGAVKKKAVSIVKKHANAKSKKDATEPKNKQTPTRKKQDAPSPRKKSVATAVKRAAAKATPRKKARTKSGQE